jgi:hypothetical protein
MLFKCIFPRLCCYAVTLVAISPVFAWSQEPSPGITSASEATDDREWLTAYMMAHQGYRLDHMDALDDTFSKMSPTQLRTLRLMYQEKHESDMEMADLERRSREHAIAHFERQADLQNQRYAMESDQAASLAERQLDTMHREAFENYQQIRTQAAQFQRSGFGMGYGLYGYGGFYRW